MKIDIHSKDIKRYIYFISSLGQVKMYGGLSSKSDFIGGVFDRWINIISEEIIFNNYFLPKISKKYKYINDFFRYEPVKTGIAPDLIGVKVGKKQVPFSVFDDSGWAQFKNAPQIELKTFKENQYLVSLRNQGYQGKYLVLIEMNLNPDYLIPFFSRYAINRKVYKSLKMKKEIFVLKGTKRSIDQTTKILKKRKLGYLNLIKVTTANEFMDKSDLCRSGISPLYVKDIRLAKTRVRNEINSSIINFGNIEGELLRFDNRWYDIIQHNEIIALSWSVNNPENVIINNISKSSITISIKENNCMINGIELLKDKSYIISYQILDRSKSNGDEYFMHKDIISIAEDYESEMIEKIRKHVQENL
jgi:hypothetical protein